MKSFAELQKILTLYILQKEQKHLDHPLKLYKWKILRQKMDVAQPLIDFDCLLHFQWLD